MDCMFISVQELTDFVLKELIAEAEENEDNILRDVELLQTVTRDLSEAV